MVRSSEMQNRDRCLGASIPQKSGLVNPDHNSPIIGTLFSAGNLVFLNQFALGATILIDFVCGTRYTKPQNNKRQNQNQTFHKVLLEKIGTTSPIRYNKIDEFKIENDAIILPT